MRQGAVEEITIASQERIWSIGMGIKLHREEEELDPSEEFEGLVEEVCWLGIFRVHTNKPFSHVALFKAMRNAWASS